MDKALEQAIEAVRQASPALWAAAQHKVAADLAVDQMAVCIGLILLAWGIVAVVVGVRNAGDWRMWPDVACVSGWLAILFSVVAIVAASIEIKQIQMAPDWYAMKALASLSPLGK